MGGLQGYTGDFADFAEFGGAELVIMVNKAFEIRPAVCVWETMTRTSAPFLNRLANTGLAVAVTVMGYAGFMHLFGQDLLACLVGAVLGGFTLGKLTRAEREATSG